MVRAAPGVAALAGAVFAFAALGARAEELPSGVRPVAYALEIEPDLRGLAFRGRVFATVDVAAPTQVITMHAADLHFGLVKIAAAGGGAEIPPPIVETRGLEQTVTLRFAGTLAKGRYVLDLPYRSRIVREPYGVFALEDANPLALRRALCTRLAPSKSRYLMPLWDDSRYVATFEVTAIVATGEAAASNRPLASRRALDDGRVAFHFTPARALRPADLFLTAGDPGMLCTRTGVPRPMPPGRQGT